MRKNTRLNILIVGAAFLLASPLARAQSAETKDTLDKKLQSQYALTKLTADRTGVVTAGAVLTLQKDGLLMLPSTGSVVCSNQYKGGKISMGLASRMLCEGAVRRGGGTPRKFVAGEKLNVTKIDVKDKSVVFDLYSLQAYGDVYYRAELSFPVEKAGVPPAAELLATTGEVFSVTPADTSDPAKTAPAPAAAPAAPAAPAAAPPPPPPPDTAPPPPPPDTPPPPPAKTITIGSTKADVEAAYGQPVSKAIPAPGKEIYVYKNIKVIFVDGKVSDVQ